jgi:hypothetical protein
MAHPPARQERKSELTAPMRANSGARGDGLSRRVHHRAVLVALGSSYSEGLSLRRWAWMRGACMGGGHTLFVSTTGT